ncbi:MAG: phage tail tape measure protein [Desulfocapsa sp.]|nr:MAG: phage tail tape measure protein [Desulfocapsa sp.]
MSATSKVQIVASLINRISGPSQKATKDLSKLERGTDKVGRAFKKQTKTVKNNARASATLRHKLDRVGGSFKRLRNEVHLTTKEMVLFSRMEEKAARRSARHNRTKGIGRRSMKGGGVTAAGSAFAITQIGRSAYDFEKGMNKASALMANATSAQMDMLRKEVRNQGATTSKTAAEVAQGLVEMAAAGIDPKTAKKLLPVSVGLSLATDQNIGTSTDILTNVGNVFGDTNYVRVGDKLAAMVTNTNANIIEVSQSMKYAGAVAKGYGISMDETGAAVMSLAQAGIKADMAGTGLQRMMNSLLDPTKKEKKALASLGMDWHDFFNKDGSSKGLRHIVNQFRSAQKEYGNLQTNVVLNTVFKERGGLTMKTLLGRPAEEMDKMYGIIRNSEGAIDRMKTKMMQGFVGAVDRASSSINDLFLTLAGKEGDGGITDFLIAVAKGVTWLSNTISGSPVARFISQVLIVGVVLGGIAVAVGAVIWSLGALASATIAAGSVLMTVGSAIAGVLGFIGIIPLAIGLAIAAVVYTVYKHWGGVVSWFTSLWNNIILAFSGAWNIIAGVLTLDFQRVKKGFGQQFSAFGGLVGKNIIGGIVNSFMGLEETFRNLLSAITPDFIEKPWVAFLSKIKSSLANMLPDWVKDAWNWIRGSNSAKAVTSVAKVSAGASVPSVGVKSASGIAQTGQTVAQRIARTGDSHEIKIRRAAASTASSIDASGSAISDALRRAAADIAASAQDLQKSAKRAHNVAQGGGLSGRLGNAFVD